MSVALYCYFLELFPLYC